jgi:DNA-binding transcriptional regulator YhcF (GntR family)
MANNQTLNISLSDSASETKLQQLTNEIIRVIHTELSEGDSLPSVNSLSQKLNISRDTVFKAYQELKRRKIVDSTPTKGYYVNREMNRVLLLLDYYSPFKDMIYREIESNLGSNYLIDLVFHHYNKHLFESVILESIGKYNCYLIMNFDIRNFEISNVLRKLDPTKLLFLDIPVENWNTLDSIRYSWVWQNFDEAVYSCLCDISDRIRKFKSFYLVIPDHLQHPPITIEAFNRFCKEYTIESGTLNALSEIEIRKGQAFFVLRQKDLATLLKLCQEREFEIGADIGILAYNDTPIYEFVSSGITVVSTDFREMGKKASQFVTDGRIIQEIVPTRVILRKSI